MNAKTFFKVLEHGRKIYGRERNLLLSDLCDVASVALDLQNHKIFKKKFNERAFGAPKVKALSIKDKNTALILGAAMKAAHPHTRRSRGR